MQKYVTIVKHWFSDWRSYLAEFLGTFVFVLICASVAVADKLYGGIGALGIAFAIGFSYASLVFVTAPRAGGYLNCALTVSLWLCGKLPGVTTVFFLLAQILASFAAAWVLLFLFGKVGLNFELGAPVLGLNVSLTSAVLFEAIFTAVLVFLVFGSMVDRVGPVSFGPLILGLYLTSASIILLPISGAALNPVRALGPLVISKSANSLAVWIIGPMAGSLFSVVYEFVFLRKGKK